MTGKNCVGICADTRLGNQAQTVATDFEKIFKMGDQLMVSRRHGKERRGKGQQLLVVGLCVLCILR